MGLLIYTDLSKIMHFTENFLKILVTSFEQYRKLKRPMIILKLNAFVLLALPFEKILQIFKNF